MSHPMTDDVVSAAISLVPRIRAAREESIVEQQMSALTQRLAHLEQAVRQWQCATMLSLIVMGALLLMGQALPKPRVIEAESFILKDTSGKIRGVLGAKPPTLSPTAHSGLGDYGLLLYASDGNYIAGLAERSNFGEAWLELYDKDTDSYASLVAGNGVAALNLKGTEQTREKAKREFEEWKKKFDAAKTTEERELLLVTRQSSGVSVELAAFPKGTSSLKLVRGSTLNSPSGIKFQLLKDGRSTLQLEDEKGARAVLGYTTLERTATGVVEQRPASSLVLFDKDGKVLWKAP